MTNHDSLRRSMTSVIVDIADEPSAVVRSALKHIIAEQDFNRAADLTHRERCAATYRRLRDVNEAITGNGAEGPLLNRPEYLYPMLEWAAMADPSLFQVMVLHHCLALGAILDLGHGRGDLDDHVGSLTAMRSIGAILMTEAGHGNSNFAVRTQAGYDAATREFVLDTPEPAAAKYPPAVGLDGVPRLAVVTAELKLPGTPGHDRGDRGTFFFIVELADARGPRPGVRIAAQPPTPLLPLDYAAVSLHGVRVPYRNWLRDTASISEGGVFDDPLGPGNRRARTVSLVRFGWQTQTVGLAAAARASASIAVRHAHHRVTSGRAAPPMPVIRYRNQQRMLFSAMASAYAAGCLARSVRELPLAPLAPDTFEKARVAKAIAQRLAERVTAQCRKASGGLGFFAVNRFVEYEGFAASANSAAGDRQMLLFEIARTMADGTGYQAPASSPPARSERSLLDRDTWTGLLHARERGLGARMRDALDEAHDTAQQLAEAYAARITVELLLASADAMDDRRARGVMEDLCALFALEELSPHAAWYVCEGLLTCEEARTFPRILDALCERIAPHALVLADALDVPDEIVGAPICSPDYAEALLAGAPPTEASPSGPLPDPALEVR